MPKRVLFIGEAVTLAHIGRPLLLADSLDSAVYETHVACAPAYERFVNKAHHRYWPIRSISPEHFRKALSKGSAIYDYPTLMSYCDDDRKLIQTVQPDFIVGDFRLSLSTSAKSLNIPYAILTNAYWSPYATFKTYPLPDHSLNYIFGRAICEQIFKIIRPIVFASHTRTFNKLRRAHNLKPFNDLRDCYSAADFTLYCDIPELVPTKDLPPHHHYLGALDWDTNIERPKWWNQIKKDKPIVYFTLGSSGRADLLPQAIEALAQMPITVLVATAGRIDLGLAKGWDNVFIADYIPGSDACNLADLVICNGGSATAYQALRTATPVIGVAANLDQFLNIMHVEQQGAGIVLPAYSFSAPLLRQTVEKMLGDCSFKAKARVLATNLAHYDAQARFQDILKESI